VGKFRKVGERIIFAKYGGNVLKIEKIGGNSKFVVDDKKGHQKFWQMKIENIFRV